MGYAYVVGDCVACGKMVYFNPHCVPSLIVNGRREPLCRACAERWNQIHPNQARQIHPGAYEPYESV